MRSLRAGKLVPTLAVHVTEWVAGFFDLLDSERVDRAAAFATGAEPLEAAFAHSGDQCFCHDAARRVAGAEE